MYQATICKIHTRPHPGADRLQLGLVAGYQIVTGQDTVDGTLGVFFPSDGQLSHEFCHYNNEYREGKGQNQEQGKFGYFEANRRVRTIKLRGAKSEGYWVPVSSLAWTGYDLSLLTEGQTFTELNDQLVCQKYYTPATHRAMNHQQKQGRKRIEIPMFKKHFDTSKLRHSISTIPDGARVVLTEKLHGTSGRTGHVLVPRPLEAWWQKPLMWFINRLTKTLGFQIDEVADWRHVSGTRRVILADGNESSTGFYAGMNFRKTVHDQLSLKKGETLFYEIVGYDDRGGALMGRHQIGEKRDPDPVRRELYKTYGPEMVYAYGCLPEEHRIYIYRITQTNTDGDSVDLSWEQVKARCQELGVQHVPEIATGVVAWFDNKLWFYQTDQVEEVAEGQLMDWLDQQTNTCSTLDTSHVMEGICIRVEDKLQHETFKYKSFSHCHLEGIAKNSDSYIDLEEIS